jgi:hypothetical protein
MEHPTQFEFALAKADYLLNYSSPPGQGGDKRKFWREIMGFESAELLREAILSGVRIEQCQFQNTDQFGDRYRCSILLTSASDVLWRICTVWIVPRGETTARFVTAYPEQSGRSS